MLIARLKSISKSWPAAFIVAGLAFSAQAQSIQDLTSRENEKKAGQSSPTRSNGRSATKINSHNIGIGVGQTFMKSDFKSLGDDKVAIPDLYYTYTASRSFDFLANFHTSEHSIENQKITTTGLALAIKGRVYQYDNFAPYLVGGFGFYRPKVKRLLDGQSLVNSEGKFTFGMNMGAGAELILNDRVTVGTILHFHNPFSVQQDNQPEVNGSYYKLLLTALYSF